MSESARHIPNYPAFIILLAIILPLILLEFSPQIGESGQWSDFFHYYKKYFGFLILFELILFGFVFAKIIIQYDRIPVVHRAISLPICLLIGFGLSMQIIAWLGYFTGGFYIFEWLNK